MTSHERPTDAEFEQAIGALREWLLPHEPALSDTLNMSRRSVFDEKGISEYFSLIVTNHLQFGATVPQVERLRDALILPLSKYCTGPDLGVVFTAVGMLIGVFRGTRNSAVFATAETVDAFLTLAAKAVKTAKNAPPEPLGVAALFNVFLELSDPDCVAIIRTPAVRDTVFVACAQFATTNESRQSLLAAICKLTESDEGQRLFATTTIRDKVIVPSGRIVETPQCTQFLLRVVSRISAAYSGCGFELFHNFAMRDKVFMPLAKHVTSENNAHLFFHTLTSVLMATDGGSDLFCTKAVRDRVFVALAKYANTSGGATACLEAMYLILRDEVPVPGNGKRYTLFAVNSVRDAVLLPLLQVRDVPSVACALLVTFAAAAPALFGTTAFRDRVILPMVPGVIAKGGWSVTAFTAMMGFLSACGSGRAVFATPRVRDELIIPLIHAAPHADCALALARVLSQVSNFCVADFAVPAVRDALVRIACLLDDLSISECADYFRALRGLVASNPTCFATCAVRDEIFVRKYAHAAAAPALCHGEGRKEFCAALSAFADTLPADTAGGADLDPLLVSDAPLSFRQQVLLLLAEKATSVDAAALLASELFGLGAESRSERRVVARQLQ